MQKVVLITGATSGIGYSAAELFVRKSWLVYATGRNSDALEKLNSIGAIAVKMDVRDNNSINEVYEKMLKASHVPDIIVNNAGYGQFGTIEELSDNKARTQFDTNVFGLASVCRCFIPQMRAKGGGRIINVSSIAGRVSIPGGGWYAASKHSVEAISDAMRWELHQFNIKVIVMQPGPVRTGFSKNVNSNIEHSPENSPYKNLISKITETGSKSPGGTPEQCAKAIYKAATCKRPKNRYLITKEAKLIRFLLYILPPKLVDSIARKFLMP